MLRSGTHFTNIIYHSLEGLWQTILLQKEWLHNSLVHNWHKVMVATFLQAVHNHGNCRPERVDWHRHSSCEDNKASNKVNGCYQEGCISASTVATRHMVSHHVLEIRQQSSRKTRLGQWRSQLSLSPSELKPATNNIRQVQLSDFCPMDGLEWNPINWVVLKNKKKANNTSRLLAKLKIYRI